MPQSKSYTAARYLDIGSEHALAQALWITTFAVLTAIGAQIEVPVRPVPFTLQSFFVLLAGSLLGSRNGFFSMSLYLLLGIVGLPVFAGGKFGLAILAGPTGGYLLSFPVAAFVVGTLLSLTPFSRKDQRRFSRQRIGRVVWISISLLAGMLVILTLGTLQLHFLWIRDWTASINSGFLIFTWWDALKLTAVTAIYERLSRRN